MNRLFYMIGLVTLMGSGLLRAQTLNATATVPFDFRVGNTMMPAGEYQVKSQGEILTVHKRGGPSAMVLTTHALRRKATDPKLEFHRYGQSYFLSKVWGPYQDGQVVHASKTEKQLLEASTLVQTASAKLQVK